jgi:glycosyltransferase involved in cell wall biosynthesis
VSLIFLNRYFHPDHSATSQMLTDLAFRLAREGRVVKVITSRQRYDAPEVSLPARELREGVRIIRVWTTRFGRDRLLGRAVDYATFYAAAAWALWRAARRGDIVVAKTDPPMLSVLAAPIARLRRARLVNWLQDVFPEVAEALGLGKGRLSATAYVLLRWLRDQSLRSADVNVAVGERMAERLAGAGIARTRIAVIPNWADGELIRPVPRAENALRREWGLAEAFVVGYSGNLGRAHEFETVLGAIAALERRADAARPALPRVLWLFVGGGAQLGALRHEAERRGLTSLRFQPYQPRERLAESLSAADVHLVSLRPELEGLIVPSKAYGIAAAGRPAIFIGDENGEIAGMLKAHGCGITVPLGDSAGLAAAVLELAANREMCRTMGEHARAALTTTYDVSVGVRKWAALLDRLQTN